MFFGFLFGYMFFAPQNTQMLAILIAGFIVILTGMIDDIKPLKARQKMIGQVIAAIIVTFYGDILLNDITFFGFYFDFGWLAYPLTIIFIVALMNCINFIDGLDGLSCGISTIFFATIGVIAFIMHNIGSLEITLTFIMLGACLGFLIFNFNPAKIFMGETGSMFLGFMISVVCLMGFKAVTLTSLVVPMLILAIPILDTLFAIIRRIIHKKPIYIADKQHLHHQLLNKKFSQRTTVLIIYAVSILFSLVSFFIIYPFVPSLAFGPSSSIIYQGIDVSSWQGSIDFAQVRNAGIDIVYMKSSEGRSYIDPYFERNYQNAKANASRVDSQLQAVNQTIQNPEDSKSLAQAQQQKAQLESEKATLDKYVSDTQKYHDNLYNKLSNIAGTEENKQRIQDIQNQINANGGAQAYEKSISPEATQQKINDINQKIEQNAREQAAQAEKINRTQQEINAQNALLQDEKNKAASASDEPSRTLYAQQAQERENIIRQTQDDLQRMQSQVDSLKTDAQALGQQQQILAKDLEQNKAQWDFYNKFVKPQGGGNV